MILKRELAKRVVEGAKYFPVVAILGPRQSGKTTLAKLAFKDHNYVSLEDLDLRFAAANDPRSFLLANGNEHGIIIDEFQHVPELLSYIQTIVDREQKPGYFILTGSQNFLMNQAITQSLAGRISIHTLLPLSIEELKENGILPSTMETAVYDGGYPAIYSKNIMPKDFYRGYLRTYIERDIRQLTQVGDLRTFHTFVTLCAARIGQILNITSLGNECGISDATVKKWLSILEAGYIIFLLQPYHGNFGKRVVKKPKIYFYDSGLACHLLKIKKEDLIVHPNKGNIFESFIICEILKWYENHDETPNIYFWQDKTGHEVDCIIESGRKVIPVEVKAARTINTRFFEGLSYWNQFKDHEPTNGYVIYAGEKQQMKGYPNVISWQSMEELFKVIS